MDYTTPRDYTTHPLTSALRLIKGEGDIPAKRVDPANLGTDFVDVQEATQAFRGCGGSGRLTLLNSGAAFLTVTVDAGFLDLEMRIQVNDGASNHVWEVIADADDQFTITNNDLIEGSDVADYTALAVADLYWETVGSTNHRRKVGTEGIAWNDSGDADGGVTSDDMPRSPTDSTDVDQALTDIEDDFAVEHDSDGTHTDEFLKNAYADSDEFWNAEGVQNILHGGMEYWPAGVSAPPKGWLLYGAPTAVVRDTTHKFGAYSAKITTGGAARGIYYPVPNYTDYQGRTVSVSAWVLTGATGGDVELELDDGVSTETGTAVTVSGSWQQIHAQIDVDAGATQLHIIAKSAAGSSVEFHVDGVMGVIGRLYKGYERPVSANLNVEEVVPVNMLLNAGFEQWHNGASVVPDMWEQYGFGAIVISKGAGTNKWGRGYLLIGAATGVGVGIKQQVNLAEVLNAVTGREVTFAAWLKLDSGTSRQFTVEVADDAGSTAKTYQISSYTDWARIWVTHAVPAGATSLEVRIYTADAGAGTPVIGVDSACLNVGSSVAPDAGAAVPSAWVPMSYHFGTPGTISYGSLPDYLDFQCAPTGTFMPSAITLSCRQGPNSVMGAESLTATLYAFTNGVAPGTRTIAVTTTADNTVWSVDEIAVTDPGTIVPISPGEVMIIYLTASGALTVDPEDVYVTVHGYAWAGV